MPRTREKTKGRRSGAPFVMLRHDLLEHPDYIALKNPAKVLLIDVLKHYNGRNNGDFVITLKVLRAQGWTSEDTMRRATKQLIDAGLLVITRQGGRHLPSLYGVTFYPIDECGGKLDVSPTKVPLRKLSLHNKNGAP